MKLAIISHTEHYIDSNGRVVGWGATVREINHVASLFDMVYHVAPLHEGNAPLGMSPYEPSNIEFVPLRPSGGERLKDKFGVVAVMPHNMAVIRRILKDCNVFQFRAPTGMGVYVIPFLLLSRKRGWFKYAGNWGESRPPLSYGFQRFLLKNQHHYKVTINGRWPNQAAHLLSFENPCLTDEEQAAGEQSMANKDFSGKLDFVFIGRLEDAKGVRRILQVFSMIDDVRVGHVHLIGDGPKRAEYEEYAKKNCKQDIVFHGFLKRNDIDSILCRSHILLLPSDSEGFPKVVAEAANYGLIPIVSDVSCIGQYVINGETGYLVQPNNISDLYEKVNDVLHFAIDSLRRVAAGSFSMSHYFTYERYLERIMSLVLD